MKKIDNFNEIDANEGGTFEKLPAGGYICEIVSATDEPQKEYLQIEYDIAEGKYKGWWANTMERAGFWGGNLFRSYKKSAAGFFKGFTNAVEQSNKGYAWNWDEKTLEKKLVGLVLGEEEYEKNDGTIGTRIYVARNTSVDKIRSGDYKVPELKKLSRDAKSAFGDKKAAFTELDSGDGDLPF